MPIGDVPIIDVVIQQLAAAGFSEITLAVGYLAELLMAYCGDGSRYGVSITYSREDTPLGTAGPIAVARTKEPRFLVMNGDLLTTIDLGEMLAYHEAARNTVTIATLMRDVPVDLGVIETDEHDRVVGYTEKPVLTYQASAGIYIFEADVLSHVAEHEYLDLPQLILRLISRDIPVGRYLSSARWLDIGRHDDYERAVELFASHRNEFLPD
jgi:NDP-sugar pyrophosphorylase family protein